MGRHRKSEQVVARPASPIAPILVSDMNERHGRARNACPDRDSELIRIIAAFNERPLRTLSNLMD